MGAPKRRSWIRSTCTYGQFLKRFLHLSIPVKTFSATCDIKKFPTGQHLLLERASFMLSHCLQLFSPLSSFKCLQHILKSYIYIICAVKGGCFKKEDIQENFRKTFRPLFEVCSDHWMSTQAKYQQDMIGLTEEDLSMIMMKMKTMVTVTMNTWTVWQYKLQIHCSSVHTQFSLTHLIHMETLCVVIISTSLIKKLSHREVTCSRTYNYVVEPSADPRQTSLESTVPSCLRKTVDNIFIQQVT